jgi:GDPmannose 4,6-dehydratase
VKKAIIFGASGQDGIYLSELLIKNNILPIKISRTENIALNIIKGDVANNQFIEELIKNEKPEYIFHLAANSTTQHDAIPENHETITTGTINILESVKRYSIETKVMIIGSGLQFKKNNSPISENDEFEYSSAYSMSRIQSVIAARYYRNLGLKTYVAYLFHHESPYRKEHHVSKMIVEQIKKIKKGETDKIKIGNSQVRKEWGYAKDIVEGIFMLINQDKIYEATIGTGITHSIQEYLDICFKLSDIDINKHLETIPNFKADYYFLVSSPKTINEIGWKAKTNLFELAKIMLENKNNN